MMKQLFRKSIFFGLVLLSAGSVLGQGQKPAADASILGTIENKVYKNDYLGFSFSIPNGWFVADRETSTAVVKAGQEILKSDSDKDNRDLDASLRTEIVLLTVSKKPIGAPENVVFMMAVQKQLSQYITPGMVAEATKSAFDRTPAMKLVADTHVESIAGKKFARLDYDVTINGKTVRIKYFVTMVSNFALSFSLTQPNDTTSPELEGVIESLEFKSR